MPSKLEHHAEQLGALGHPVRLAILRFAVQAGAEGAVMVDAGVAEVFVGEVGETLGCGGGGEGSGLDLGEEFEEGGLVHVA